MFTLFFILGGLGMIGILYHCFSVDAECKQTSSAWGRFYYHWDGSRRGRRN